MSLKAVENIEFQLVNIEILESHIAFPVQPIPENPIFNFDVSLVQRVNPDKELIVVVCDISTILKNNIDYKLGKYSASYSFRVKELKKFMTEDKKFNLSDSFILTINSVAISTTRGLMFSSFKGTFLHEAILPLIDPNQFKN
jgi:hypothetical protein